MAPSAIPESKIECLSDMIVEHLQNYRSTANQYESEVNKTEYYTYLRTCNLPLSLLSKYNQYQGNRSNPKSVKDLNIKILESGINIPPETLLFHGTNKLLSTINLPISCSLYPDISIWHARKHWGDGHAINGENPIYLYVFQMEDKSLIKGVVDLNRDDDDPFVHEREVLLQGGIFIEELSKQEVTRNFYLITAIIKTPK